MKKKLIILMGRSKKSRVKLAEELVRGYERLNHTAAIITVESAKDKPLAHKRAELAVLRCMRRGMDVVIIDIGSGMRAMDRAPWTDLGFTHHYEVQTAFVSESHKRLQTWVHYVRRD